VVHLTEEPVAAAHFALTESQGRRGDLVLIYDFGGGTFDAALVEIGDYGQLNIRGYDGEPDCGGIDIDGHIIEEVKRQAGQSLRSQLDPRDRTDDSLMRALETKLELPRIARKWKHLLSVDNLTEDELLTTPPVSLSLSREKLEQMAEPYVKKTITACERLLEKNRKVPDELTRIITVGGSSRMPIVNRMLSAHFRRPIIAATDPELATAHGAALIAASRARGAVPDLQRGKPVNYVPSTMNLPELALPIPGVSKNGQYGPYIHAPFLLAELLWEKANSQDAERWYVLAAEAGHIRAAYQLGWMCKERGDHDAAAMWWEKAARAGDAEAAYYLGELLWYLNAPERAEPWFLQSAQGGHAHSAYQLGWLHKYRGDLKGASYFWDKAARAGDVDAAGQLELLLKERGPR
jgi:hypothetical protein